jgi:cbb3-type cytochrome oxidase subunit 1
MDPYDCARARRGVNYLAGIALFIYHLAQTARGKSRDAAGKPAAATAGV